MTALVLFQPRPPGRLARWFFRRFATAVTLEFRPDGLHASDTQRAVYLPRTAPGIAPLFGGAGGTGDYEALVGALRMVFREIVVARRLPLKPSATWRGLASLGAG